MNSHTEKETKTIRIPVDAETLYHEAESAIRLWKSSEEDGIRLFRGEVVESDSPGSGHSDKPEIEPFIRVEGPVEIRKTLRLDKAVSHESEIGFIAIEDKDNPTTLRIQINGMEVLRTPSAISEPEAHQYTESWSRWYYVGIPADVLGAGDNEIRFSAVDGGKGWQLMVADYREFDKGMKKEKPLPTDSEVSQDGGDSWTKERGEYVVRLLLDRHLPDGQLVSRVFDCAGQQDEAVRTEIHVDQLSFDWDSDSPSGGDINIFYRTGPTETIDVKSWTPWCSCECGKPVGENSGRYAQLKIIWQSTDLLKSPELKGIEIIADLSQIKQEIPRIVAFRNPRILRSSYEMNFEKPRTPKLQQLRKECELDAVVAGAQTEFDAIQRLHRWAYHIPLGSCSHTPWDPLDWIDIRRDADGNIELNTYEQRRRDMMCLYPNLVLTAALQSFGLPARHLNFHSEGMTGHEICEVWSNDHNKWIHLDATRDYYWYDRRTLIPLDTEEIHRVLVERLENTETWKRPYLFFQDLEKLIKDLPITYWDGEYEHSNGSGDHGAHFLFRSFCHFRIVPRFNVFSQEFPIPVSQGTEVWSWNGYLNWAEDKVPPLRHFSQHTNRRADFYPTLNQTRYTANYGDCGRQINFSLESSTHDFEAFEIRINRGDWKETCKNWQWTLENGMNTAEMRSLNGSGQPGVVSMLSVII